MSVISAPRPRLPDQITIDFGPADLLGPAFLQLDRAARERGVYLSISTDFEELARVNALNLTDWYPLVPMFDPSVGGVTSENGFWISGINEHGEIVATQAARFYLWPDTTFAEEWRNRTFIYPDPRRQAQIDEHCTEDCAAARQLTGRVCHTGALWMRSDYRNQGLASIIPRLTRAYALTSWLPDFTFGIAKKGPAVTPQVVRRLYGWRNFDGSLQWYNSPHLGDILDIAVVWMNEREVTSDLQQFMQLLGKTAQPQSMAA